MPMKYLILLLLIACSTTSKKYPSHWWKPVSKKQIRWWEIAPDFVSPDSGKVILSKRNELGLLSNFADTPFVYDGIKYKTVEGLWQSMKFPESANDKRYGRTKLKYTRVQVSQMRGFAAKKAGDYATELMKKYKIKWVSFKGKKMVYRTQKKGAHYNLIRSVMKAKLAQNPKVKKVLSSTGDLTLLADHTTNPLDPPAWKYYKIWMELRD